MKKKNILFASESSLYPYMRTGAEISMHHLLKNLSLLGYNCHAIGCMEDFIIRNKLYNQKELKGLSSNTDYKTYQFEFISDYNDKLEGIIGKIKPNIIITNSPGSERIVKYALTNNIPVIFFVHSMQKHTTHNDCFKTLETYGTEINYIISVSNFIKQRIYNYFNLEAHTVYPIIDLGDSPKKIKCIPNYITLINSSMIKGIQTFIALAKHFADEKFLLVESWSITDRPMIKRLKQIKNITLLPFQEDISRIYMSSKLVIVPSECDEAFCRVIVEAKHFNTPILANNIGGISEAMGTNENLIPYPYKIEDWIKKVDDLLLKQKSEDDSKILIDKQSLLFSQKEYVMLQFQQIINELLHLKGD